MCYMKKKFTLIRISYVLLAVTLIGAVLGVKTYTCSNETKHDGSFNTTNKAMSPSCRKSLEYANNTNATKEFMMWWARAVSGDGFMAMGIGFENMAGPLKYQAVALRVSGDMAIFYNCAMNGYQDTLYAHSNSQFYPQCTITGTIDFIFGNASAVFQDCKMIVRKPLDNQVCTMTAQGRTNRTSKGALVLQGCTITTVLKQGAATTIAPNSP
ncbi:pectinesterase-like [Helianthus annuus]|nr:pectinesterase-like [Helianthus annuus]